jgi:hypothetical protein
MILKDSGITGKMWDLLKEYIYIYIIPRKWEFSSNSLEWQEQYGLCCSCCSRGPLAKEHATSGTDPSRRHSSAREATTNPPKSVP